MKWLTCIVCAATLGGAAACGDNQAGLGIVTPGSGAIVETTQPLVLHMTGNGFSGAAQTVVDIDSSPIDGATSTLGSDCNPCEFDVTVPVSGVTPSHHTVTVTVDIGGSEIAQASEELAFEAPGSGG